MAFLLGCEKARVDFPTKTVFESISLGVDEGVSSASSAATATESRRFCAFWPGR